MEKLIKEIKRLRDKARKEKDKMQRTGEWLPISDFSELEGYVDALDAVLLYCKTNCKEVK